MRRHESIDERKTRLPASTKLKLLGGAAAATLVGLVSGCGGSSRHTEAVVAAPKPKAPPKPRDEGTKWDPRTETKLRTVIKPAMDAAAGDIVAFAEKHPGLSAVSTGDTLAGFEKGQVDLWVHGDAKFRRANGRIEKDEVNLHVVSRRVPHQPGKINLNAVLGVSVFNTVDLKKRPPRDEYYGDIDLTAPTGAQLPFSDTPHTDGWSAEQYGGGFSRTRRVYESSLPGLYNPPRDPVDTAQKVAGHLPQILQFAESDLGFILTKNG